MMLGIDRRLIKEVWWVDDSTFLTWMLHAVGWQLLIDGRENFRKFQRQTLDIQKFNMAERGTDPRIFQDDVTSMWNQLRLPRVEWPTKTPRPKLLILILILILELKIVKSRFTKALIYTISLVYKDYTEKLPSIRGLGNQCWFTRPSTQSR